MDAKKKLISSVGEGVRLAPKPHIVDLSNLGPKPSFQEILKEIIKKLEK